ncbi:MAG TPA: hypothetical protein VEK08_24975 [Planctomycetota bacterium]|nr:hypothetical protein [Planctomycetota bacterium]
MSSSEIVIYESKRKVIKQAATLFAIFILIAIGCVVMYYMNLYSVKLLLVGGFVGLAALWYGFKAMLPARVMLTLTPEGLAEKKVIGQRFLAWRDIERIEIKLAEDFEHREVRIVPRETPDDFIRVNEEFLPGSPEELQKVLEQYRENVTGIPASGTAAPAAG